MALQPRIGTFTNNWDDTFPPDTEFADLYAGNLRSFRTDIQQRMANISGLDANKPTFWNDDTSPATGAPAKWNGLLFFATDTGKIYQFQYVAPPGDVTTSWVDVTFRFGPHATKVGTIVFVSGPNSLAPGGGFQTIYGGLLTFPPLLGSTRIRLTINYVETSAHGGGASGMAMNIGNASNLIIDRGIVAAPGGLTHTILIEGGNTGDPGHQQWIVMDVGQAPFTQPVTPTTFNTASGGAFNMNWQASTNTSPPDTATFYGAILELL